MKSAEEFQTMERKDRYGLIRSLYNLEEGALPVEVEAACYDAAGAIAATLYYDFDLKKISKRDVFLFVRVTTFNNADSISVHINKVHRYIKGHFAAVMQGPLTSANLKY